MMGTFLHQYSLHYFKGRKLAKTEERNFLDDLDALDAARSLAENDDIVVWNGHRYVARVKRNCVRPRVDEPSG